MKIQISMTLNMNDEQMRSWANEYGLDTEEVPQDARNMIGDIVKEAIERTYHVPEFTTITRYTVK